MIGGAHSAGTAVRGELLRRGYGVRMAVQPDPVGFVEAAGLAMVAYGPFRSRSWTRISLATSGRSGLRSGSCAK